MGDTYSCRRGLLIFHVKTNRQLLYIEGQPSVEIGVSFAGSLVLVSLTKRESFATKWQKQCMLFELAK